MKTTFQHLGILLLFILNIAEILSSRSVSIYTSKNVRIILTSHCNSVLKNPTKEFSFECQVCFEV